MQLKDTELESKQAHTHTCIYTGIHVEIEAEKQCTASKEMSYGNVICLEINAMRQICRIQQQQQNTQKRQKEWEGVGNS